MEVHNHRHTEHTKTVDKNNKYAQNSKPRREHREEKSCLEYQQNINNDAHRRRTDSYCSLKTTKCFHGIGTPRIRQQQRRLHTLEGGKTRISTEHTQCLHRNTQNTHTQRARRTYIYTHTYNKTIYSSL